MFTFDRQGLRSFTNWTRSSIVSITLNKKYLLILCLNQLISKPKNSKEIHGCASINWSYKVIPFVGISYLRYCQVVEHLLTVSAQLSHLMSFILHIKFFSIRAIAHCVKLWFCLIYCQLNWKVSKLMSLVVWLWWWWWWITIGDDDGDTDLGGIKANEHGGRPLKNSPRTLNQTVSAPLGMAIMIMIMMMIMAVKMMIIINDHDEHQNMIMILDWKAWWEKVWQ